MSLKRTPPNKGKQSNTASVSGKLLTSSQHGMDRSLSESKLSEYSDNTETNITQRLKRKREEDLIVDFGSFKEEIKTMIQSFMTSQQKEIETITSNLKEIQQSNHNIDNSIALLTSQNEELRRKVDQLEGQIKRDNEHISLIEEKVEDMQRESRRANIEIKNVPKKKNENKEDLMAMVLGLSKTVCYEVNRTDIKDIYRVNGRKNVDKKSTPIIVELGSTIMKTELLKMCKLYNVRNNKNKLQAKHLGFTSNEDDPIYVSELLTAKAARLYFLARDLTKSKHYNFCWTSFGRVYVRLNESSPIIQIRNETQVHHLMQAVPVT